MRTSTEYLCSLAEKNILDVLQHKLTRSERDAIHVTVKMTSEELLGLLEKQKAELIAENILLKEVNKSNMALIKMYRRYIKI
jgi:ribosomal protein L29